MNNTDLITITLNLRYFQLALLTFFVLQIYLSLRMYKKFGLDTTLIRALPVALVSLLFSVIWPALWISVVIAVLIDAFKWGKHKCKEF